ncbi:MAG: ABC transporter permease [Bryobacterales bacterium]|nr:ABC transporter permease [Bryobacterales bacterium]
MSTLWQDVIYGFRMLVKRPGFTSVAALSLALGIGANTLVFSLINGTLLRPLPFPDPGKMVVIWSSPLNRPDQRNNVNVSSYFAYRDRSQSYTAVGAFNGGTAVIGAEENGAPAERINGETFTPSMFKAIGVQPILGRIFTDEEDQIGNVAPVVVISHRFWQRHFNGDPNIVGRAMMMDKASNTIIGVMPRDFSFFQDDCDFWVPQPIGRTQALSRQGFLLAVGRLKPGVSMKQAQAEASGIAAQLASSDPERNQGVGANVQGLQEAAYGGLRSPLLILQGAVAFVLLIGCANVAGLMLARAASRRTEMAVRSALGAGRWRIVRQLIMESVPLSLLGGFVGVFLAWGGLKLFLWAEPPGFLRQVTISMDAEVLGFTAVVAILTAVIFGIVPAIQASKPNLVNSLKESGRSGTDTAARHHARSALVALQIAMALVLLIGAGLMINSFLRVQRTDLGANPQNLLTFEFRFPQGEAIKPYSRYRGLGLWDISPQTTLTFTRLFDRLQSLPGVTSVAGINRPPLTAGGVPMPFLIEGRPAPPSASQGNGSSQEQAQTGNYFAVTPGFFSTMKIPIVRGREFTSQDTAAAPLVLVISQTLAKRYFPNEEPLGKRITLDFVPDEQPRQIVGIAGDVVLNRLDTQGQRPPLIYVPYTQQTPRWMGPYWNDRAAMYFVLRTPGEPKGLVSAVRSAVAEVDPNKPPGTFRTVEDYLDQQVQYLRLYIVLLGIFGGVAAVLAAAGIYGVMSYSVAERTREIGIRMALGAGAPDVLSLVVRQALILIAIGLAVGLGASFALTRVVKSALYGITATDPATYVGVSVTLAAVALMACFIPTRRAVLVEPTVALRYE